MAAMMGKKRKTVEITNKRLEEIFQRSADQLQEMGAEAEEDLLAMIAATAEEAMNQGKEKLVVVLNHAIRIDLGKSEQKDSLTWRVSCKTERTTRLDDPDQDQMDMGR